MCNIPEFCVAAMAGTSTTAGAEGATKQHYSPGFCVSRCVVQQRDSCRARSLRIELTKIETYTDVYTTLSRGQFQEEFLTISE
jgi:hypothetical protein